MKRFVLALLLALTLSTSPVMADTVTPSSVVKDFYAQLVTTMKQGPQLGFSGRFKQLSPVIQSTYNMQLMTRFAVGPSWTSTSTEDQQKLITAFTAFSAATYASRFSQYDGELFEVVGEKPANGGGFIVETRLTPKGSDPVKLNYLIKNDDKGTPRIVDVLLDATISELATRRSEFSSIVKQNGVAALIMALEEKTKKMETI